MWDQWIHSLAQEEASRLEPENKPVTVEASSRFPKNLLPLFSPFTGVMEWWRWMLAIGGLCLLCAGIFFLFESGQAKSPEQPLFPEVSVSATASAQKPGEFPQAEMIFVDIAGAVKRPGVQSLQKSDRAGEALAAAGGLTRDANQEYLSKYFNGAAHLEDGQKIYIPFQQESLTDYQPANNRKLPTSSQSADSTISINTASANELDALPGIGAARAEQIIAGRPYAQLEELTARKIVPQSIYDSLDGLIKL